VPHPFIVGERYFDRNGEYTVVRIDGDRITVRYDNDREAEGNLEDRARIYRNMVAEYRVPHPLISTGYFRMLGFLAAHAEFQAEVPPQSQQAFEENYYSLTATRPVLHQRGYYPIQVQQPGDKWGPELRIYLPEPGIDFELPVSVQLRAANAPDLVRINNNTFWWQLVRIGFRLGRTHLTETIRGTVPPAYSGAFEAGLAA